MIPTYIRSILELSSLSSVPRHPQAPVSTRSVGVGIGVGGGVARGTQPPTDYTLISQNGPPTALYLPGTSVITSRAGLE